MKFIIPFFILSILIYSCESDSERSQRVAKENGFIYLNDKEFMLGDSVFFPVMMNYMVDFMEVGEEIIPVPNVQYDSLNIHIGTSKEEWLGQLENHFELLNKLGFNSIRLVGYNSDKYDDSGKLLINLYDRFGNYNKVKFTSFNEKFENAIKKVIDLSAKHQLKVMILLPNHRQNEFEEKSRIEFIKSTYALLKNNNNVFSYDLCNEPLYFDKSDALLGVDQSRSKYSALQLVKEWKKLKDSLAPYQLSTIGFGEPLEAFEWDPSILPLDFVSFHTYNPLRVPNEIYWWSKYVDKPLIISETSLPSDNDSILYTAQSDFMEAAFKRAVDCGISGFGWWQFQDVYWGDNFEHNYTALLDHKGITYLKDSSKAIYGSVKPAGWKLKHLLDYQPSNDCICYNNYRNIVGYKNYRVDGYIIDSLSNKPIEGAIIRGYIDDWTIASNTFTDENGHFSLYSNDKMINLHITALGYEMIYMYNGVEYEEVNPKAQLSDIQLEYQNVHYKNYLENDSTNSNGIFTFKKDEFNQYKFFGELNIITLNRLNLNNEHN